VTVGEKESGDRAISTNRKAYSNYEVLERVEAGVSLLGTEVKSIREGGFSFRDGYVDYRNGELWLVGVRVAPYSHGNFLNHTDERDRRLLLHKREIAKIGGRATERGLTIVPLRAYFKAGRIKIEIGLARGRKTHDKREVLKRRDQDRETRRALASRD
jgi:SsrA-binding protein